MSETVTTPQEFATGARLGTEADVARALSLSVSGVRKLKARGTIPAVKLGAAVRYHWPTVLRKLKLEVAQ